MAASKNVNIGIDIDIDKLVTSSQPNLSSLDTLDTTDVSSKKRPIPESPDNLPGTQKQQTRQIRRRNSIGDVCDLSTITKKAPALRKSITDKVLEALTSPEVLNEIIPVLSKKIGESLTTVIQSQVKDCLDSRVFRVGVRGVIRI